MASKAAGPAKGIDSVAHLRTSYERLRGLHARLAQAGLADSYEAAHARLAIESVAVLQTRQALLSQGKLKRLPEPSQSAADKSYIETAVRLCDGLVKVLASYADSKDPRRRRVGEIWGEGKR